MVPQAQERKPQVAYKTEIIGGVVVHTPISINQVSWQDPRTGENPRDVGTPALVSLFTAFEEQLLMGISRKGGSFLRA